MGDSIIDFDGLVEGLTLNHVEDGGEEFLIEDLGMFVDGHDSGFDEETLPVLEGLTSVEDLTTLFLNFLNTLLIILDGGLSVEGSTEGTLLERITDLD